MKKFLMLPFRLAALAVTATAIIFCVIAWTPCAVLEAVFGRGPGEE
jgi:hypothetical protein